MIVTIIATTVIVLMLALVIKKHLEDKRNA